jgi:hypothetical protein
MAIVPAILAESDVNKQLQQWQGLKVSKSITKFGQASLARFLVSLAILEPRTSLTPEALEVVDCTVDTWDIRLLNTVIVLWATSWAAGLSVAWQEANPGDRGSKLILLIPIVLFSIGCMWPDSMPKAIAAIKGGMSGKYRCDGNVSLHERSCRHEAAHFCCGYWCGLPVTDQYSVKVKGKNVTRVEFDCTPEAGIYSSVLSKEQVAGLAVTALAGTVGEALQWKSGAKCGRAKNDLQQLDVVCRQTDSYISEAAQQDLTRWGAVTAAMLLKKNRESYEKVVQAFA